jgi:SAM-dependent methyltransferase
VLRHTPLHPQWLLGPKLPPKGLEDLSGRVLDVGSGDGWIWPHLPRHIDYVSLDYPATGKALYGARPAVFADAAALPFQADAFEAVICLEVLEHVKDPGSVLSEVSRVLKPGGCAWFSTPFLYPIHDAPHDFTRFTEHGWRFQAKAHGLEVTTIRKSNHAIAAAAVLWCLAISSAPLNRVGPRAWLAAALAIVTVPSINIFAWLLCRVIPDWKAMASGYAVQLRKPQRR